MNLDKTVYGSYVTVQPSETTLSLRILVSDLPSARVSDDVYMYRVFGQADRVCLVRKNSSCTQLLILFTAMGGVVTVMNAC